METMINLTDLLKHEILDLYSAEEQIIDAMPAMIEKAKNPELKRALREHLKITEEQKVRLDKIKVSMGEDAGQGEEKKGFFSRLFGGGSGGEKCRGMEGLITEGQKIMNADITDQALDAAIIASAQKIEHYEICGYGTARAFARELNLPEVERLLTQTLNEEYKADDNLTTLAVSKLNLKAEQLKGVVNESGGREKRTGQSSSPKKRGTANKSKSANSGSTGNSASGRSTGSKSPAKSSAGSSKKSAASKSSSRLGSIKPASKNASKSKGAKSKSTRSR